MIEIKRERTHEPREINLVPLINVVFLLLIFFLVTSTIKEQDRISVDVPVSKSSDAEEIAVSTEPITIAISASQEITLNNTLIPMTELASQLNNILHLGGNQERLIKLMVDHQLEATQLINVMEHIRKAGGINISLITQTE